MAVKCWIRAPPRHSGPRARPGMLRRYPQFTISPAILLALLAAWWLATDVLGAPTTCCRRRKMSCAPWSAG